MQDQLHEADAGRGHQIGADPLLAEPLAEPSFSGYCAPLTCAPEGADASFRGDLFEFLQCVAIACPYLEQADFAGRRPLADGSPLGADESEVRVLRAVAVPY